MHAGTAARARGPPPPLELSSPLTPGQPDGSFCREVAPPAGRGNARAALKQVTRRAVPYHRRGNTTYIPPSDHHTATVVFSRLTAAVSDCAGRRSALRRRWRRLPRRGARAETTGNCVRIAYAGPLHAGRMLG